MRGMSHKPVEADVKNRPKRTSNGAARMGR